MSPPIPIDSLNDPRLFAYRNLRERELAKLNGRFIAESEHLVRRLLASDFVTDSVLVAQRRLEEISQIVPPHVPLYVVPDPLMHEVIGFHFHSGVIACGRRKPRQPLEQFLSDIGDRSTLVICPEVTNHENLGSLIRISSAFGVDAILLGERSCDPFFRRSIRVSMGTIFHIPMIQSENLHEDMTRLRNEFGYELVATVLSENAEPLSAATRGSRLGILFGNEAQGLSVEDLARCDRQVTIPMQRGTDSLNVSIAAGIFLYHFTATENVKRET